MRKTHIALLVAVVCSPGALALTWDPCGDSCDATGGSGETQASVDIDVIDSFKKKVDVDFIATYDKDVKIKDSYNDDSDTMVLHDVNNKYKFEFSEYHKTNISNKVDIDYDLDVYVAMSKLDGAVMGNSVNYGAGGYGMRCCNLPGTVDVDHGNYMKDSFVNAAGINIAAQNAGNNSLIQQSASTNAASPK